MEDEVLNILKAVKRKHSLDYMRAYTFALEWIKTQMRPFTSEDLKQAFYEAKNEPPKQVNVFGSLFNHLRREGLIKQSGFTVAKLKPARGRALRTWISLSYRLQQQANANAPRNHQLSIYDCGA